MKTKIALLVFLSLSIVNCSKSSDSAPTATPTPPVVNPGTSPYTPPTTGPGQGPGLNFQYGGTADFVFDSKGVYTQYTGRYINSLAEIGTVKINLNYDKYNNSFGGTTTIRYNYQGSTYEGFFTSGNSAETTKYNVWFTAPQLVWHGFFEDFRGSIVVVLDNATSLQDGVSDTDTVSGSVWFKNFGYADYGHPATYCWFIYKSSQSAFDCRAWKNGNGVNTTAGIYPDAGYTRLGTFTNMPAKAAFNGSVF